MKNSAVQTRHGWIQWKKQALLQILLTCLCGFACLGSFKPTPLAAATIFQGTNSAAVTINDATLDMQGNTVFSAATPYPSAITVSGLSGEVSHVTVTVWNLGHTSCFDISMLLVSPQGQGIVLMSQVGGFNPISVNRLAFDDSATTALPTIRPWVITNGVYRPTDGVVSNYFLPPAPPGPYPTNLQNNYDITLSALNGTNPNGTWSLYVQDESPGDSGKITNGWSLTIATAFSISGKVAAYGSGSPVSEATLNVTGDTNATGSTVADGTYRLLVYQGGTYSVTPSKTDDNPPNDGVTTFDILLIRQHVLNTVLLNSPYKVLAADANGSGTVTTSDILSIRQLVLANTTNLPAGLWRFVPASYVFPNPQSPWSAPNKLSYTNVVSNIANQDFVAIKMGDVNNSWAPSPLAHVLGNGPNVDFTLPNLTAQPGDTVKAGISVGAFQAVTSVQFTLQWDPTVLEFVGVGDFGLSSLASDNFGTNHINDGQLTFSWDDPQLTGVTLSDNSSIFSTSFRVLGANGSQSPLAFVDSPTAREVTVNAALATFAGHDGAIGVGVTNVPGPVLTAGFDPANNTFRLSVPTLTGVNYVVEYTDQLPTSSWNTLSTLLGDGTAQLVTDPGVTNQARFYRVRTQ